MSLARRSGLLLALVLLAACGKKADDALSQDSLGADSTKSAPLALQVVGEEVRVGDLVLTVEAVGTVRTDAVSSLKAEGSGGTVQEVLVRAGQRVTAGQPLVRLDPKPFDLALAEAKAALSSAQMTYQTEILADSIAEGRVRPERRAFMQAKAGIEGAEVRLEKAKLDRERAVVTAPYAGMIEKVNVAVGERIGAGAEVAVIVDLNNLRVEAQVLEHNLPLLKPGGDAFVTVAASPNPIKGTISAILPIVDSITKSGKAVVRIRGDGILRPGMFANLRLEATRLPGRTVVPKRAVIERDGRPLVFVVREGIAEWVYIQPGQSNGLETEVLPDSASGQIPLKAGDVVLIDGHLTLTHQAPVRLVAKRETAQ